MDSESLSYREKLKASFWGFSFQEILSFGYLLLVLTGMLMEFCTFIGFRVNIFRYSNIFDFLIAPFKNIMVLPLTLLILGLAIYISKQQATKKAPSEDPEEQLEEELDENPASKSPRFSVELPPLESPWPLLRIALMFTLGLSVGMSTTQYLSTKKKVEAGLTNTTLMFNNGMSERVWMFNKNEAHLFYFQPGDTKMIIAPLGEQIRAIQPD